MNLKRALAVFRTLFILLLLGTFVLALKIGNGFRIDTDLADVSPTINNTVSTRAAITQLSQSIEQRVLLLVSGVNEEQVFDAEFDLRERLSTIDGLLILPTSDQLFEDLVAGLKPYRFSLLNGEQRNHLAVASNAEIARAAKTDLFDLSGQPRLYSFSDDPLGWHSQTVFSLFTTPGFGTSLNEPEQVSAVISIKIQRGALNMRAQEALSKTLDAEVLSISSNYNVEINRSGVFFFAAHAAKSSKKDISLISIGSTIGVIVLLLFAFKSIRGLVLPIVSVGLGVGFAFVVTHSIFGQVHILTIVFGASLIGIVIDYSLHYFYHGAQYDTRDFAVSTTVPNRDRESLYKAMVLSLMTSLIGYAALGFSDLEALQKVALFSCCGLLMAWLSVVCLGDLALRRPLTTDVRVFPLIVDLLSKPLAKIKPALWVMVVTIVILAAVVIITFGRPFNDDPRVFFTAPTELINSEKKVAAVANDYEPGRYLIIHGDDENIVQQRHAQLLERINTSESFDRSQLVSFLTWVPSIAQQDENYRLQAKLYAERGAAAWLLDDLKSELPFTAIQMQYANAEKKRLTPDIVNELIGEALPPFWIQSEKNIVNFVLIKKGADTKALEDLVAPIQGVEYVNTLTRTQAALAEQRVSATDLLLLAYALVAILVLVRYKELNSLWLVAVPVCSSAMLIIVSSLLGFDLNLFHVMALFLVLGFGMDYTIFAREITHRQNITLQAILLSALTSLLSFGLLGLSSIPVVASFGVTLLIGNVFNLIGVLIYAQTRQSLTHDQRIAS